MRDPADTAGTGLEAPGLMALPNLAAANLGDLHQNLTTLIEGVIQTNLRLSKEVLSVTNPNEFIALQQRFIRDYLAALMQGSLQLVGALQRPAAGHTSLQS